ncbi:hypothetical protein PTKIN_Ptkin06aG0112600 [Pterospermum kingtungense]
MKPPVERIYKVNFNEALRLEDVVSGVRVVIRDWQGNVMGVMHTVLERVVTTDMIEAFTAAKALSFAKRYGVLEYHLRG